MAVTEITQCAKLIQRKKSKAKKNIDNRKYIDVRSVKRNWILDFKPYNYKSNHAHKT